MDVNASHPLPGAILGSPRDLGSHGGRGGRRQGEDSRNRLHSSEAELGAGCVEPPPCVPTQTGVEAQ